jgi:hypothetical protein
MFTFYKTGLKGEQIEKGVGPLSSALELQDKFNLYEKN